MTFFREQPVAPQALRRAMFWLGNKHQGNVLAGAWLELQSPGLTREKRQLLEAVILHLSPDRQERPFVREPVIPEVTPLAVAALAGVVSAAMALLSMFVW